MRFIGIDGCRAGWITAETDSSLKQLTFRFMTDLKELPLGATDARVLIDVPIGLPDGRARLCDREARAYLGWPRRTSVFPAPHRTVLECHTYAEASAQNARATGALLTQQTWAIVHKIQEVDQLMTPEIQHRVREAHPEVTFAALTRQAEGQTRGLSSRKRDRTGEIERLNLLAGCGIRFDPEREREQLRKAIGLQAHGVPIKRDDLIDAAACLASVLRLHRGAATVFPAAEQLDARRLRMEIVA